MTGKKFGKLTVIERDYEYSKDFASKRPYWICKCECGKIIVLSSFYLVSGRATSCDIRRKLPSGESAFNMLFRNYSSGARARGLEFSLTKEEFRKLTQEKCTYCGDSPNYIAKKGKDKYVYNGIDRVDSRKGYSKENVVPCCGKCNNAKKEMSQKDFLLWVEKVYNYTKGAKA